MADHFIYYKKNKTVKASFTDYVVKILTKHEVIQDKEIDNLLTQEIKINKDLKVLVAVKEEIINEVYASVQAPDKLISVVPYGLAIVALLKEKGVSLEKTLVFIDYQTDLAYLTVIDRGVFNAPRVIESTYKEQVMHEVEKTVKHYIQSNKDLSHEEIRILSNEEIGVLNPAVSGMELATFDVNFDLPSRIIAHKKKTFLINRWIKLLGSLWIITIGVGVLLFCEGSVRSLKGRNQDLTQTHQQRANELANLEISKIYTQIKNEPTVDFRETYLRVIKKAPLGTRMHSLLLEKQSNISEWLGKVEYQINNESVLKKITDLDLGLLNERKRFVSENQSQYIEVVFNINTDGKSDE